MTKNPQSPIAGLLCAAMFLVPAPAPAQQPASANALRIVVISGEDAVNIIQQKTAVNPIVEVRDRNNLPVSGVAVTFSVGGQGASFAGGASTLTLTTNAAGQAVVTGLTPTATGAVTINASAVVNGQTIAATITQTNFATAAEAASAASAGPAGGGGGAGSGSGAGAGGGGGIGGISGATLGIVGGAVAAGGLLAATAGGGSDSPSTPPGSSIGGTYNGTFSGTFISTGTSSTTGVAPISCTSTYSVTGTLRIVLNNTTDGSATGTGTADAILRETSSNCDVPGTDLSPDGQPVPFQFTGPVTGNSSSLRFTQEITQNQNIQGAQINTRVTSTFTGSISGNSITGAVSINSLSSVNFSQEGITITATGTGTGTFPATLTR